MKEASHSPEQNNFLKPFVSNGGMTLEAATEVAKRLRLNSFEDLVKEKSLFTAKALELLTLSLQEDGLDGARDHMGLAAESLRGVIPLKDGEYWIFFRSRDIFEGADAIAVSLIKPELGERAPNNILVDHDMWIIQQREPLLLESIYGAFLGFKKEKGAIICHVIHEGDDGWSG